jgi:hypothetical protein
VTIWIISPVYLDVEAFLELRRQLVQTLRADPSFAAIPTRFVVVDDTAGADPEIAELERREDVEVIEPPFNLGHQRAIVHAVRTVGRIADDSDAVVTLDADGEDKPQDVPRLLDALAEDPSDRTRIVLAKRTKRRESLGFKILYRVFKLGFRLLTGTTVQSGNFAAYRGWTAKRVISHPSFDLSYSSAIVSLDLPVRLVPCERGYRYAGESRMGYGRLTTHAMRMLMPFAERIATRALAVFAATLALATVLAVAVLATKLFTDAAVPGWATYSLSFAAVLSLVSFGNLVTLFALFSQSRAISLAGLEND